MTSKYHAVRCEIDGEKFDSRAERDRWLSLKRDPEVSRIVRQVPYHLAARATILGKYVADFVYLRNGVEVIEDVKGVLTPLCRWKLKHMAAQGNPVTLWPEPKKKARKKKGTK